MNRLVTLLLLATVCLAPTLVGQDSAPANARQSEVTELRQRIEGDDRGHPVISVQCAEEALRRLGEEGDPQARVWFLLALVRDLNTLSEYERAASYVVRARPLVARVGSPTDHFRLEVTAIALLSSQEHYREGKAALDDLLPKLEAAVAKAPHHHELRQVLGQAYRVAGGILNRLGDRTGAIRSYTRAQKQYEEIGDPRGQGMVLDRMARLYEKLGQYQQAERSNQQAIALAESCDDLGLQASFRLGLSNVYASMNVPDRQLAELEKAGKLAARARDTALTLRVTVNLADTYLKKRDYRTARYHAEEALRLSLAARDPFSVALCQVNRGIALNRLGLGSEGLQDIRTGLAHFRAAGNQGYVTEITGILAEEYAFAGDYRRAYEAHLAFKALGDEFQKRENQKHIAEASAAFESDKKQFQIDALQREQRDQSRLRLLWIAIGVLGFATALVLVIGRIKLRAANHALAEMSLKDPLTSLANRRYLSTRIEEDLAQIHRLHRNGPADSPVAPDRALLNIDVVFLMIDIDHFKQVNDRYGHAAGDSVLRQFAGILTRAMRGSDTVVSWGGEEFFVVAKQTARADAHIVAERIRSRVAAHPFDLGGGVTLHKTCSVGFASYPLTHDDPVRVSWEHVAGMADQCLYAAKTSGRDAWVGVHPTGPATENRLAGSGGDIRVAAMVEAGLLRVESNLTGPVRWPTAID